MLAAVAAVRKSAPRPDDLLVFSFSGHGVREGGEFVYHRLEDTSLLAGTEFLMLREGQVHFQGSARELETSRDPYVRDFLS